MTLASFRSRAGLRAVLCLLLFLSIAQSQIGADPVPAGKPPAYPGWWFSRSVIPRLDSTVQTPTWPDDYRQADDYAVLNQGQLKTLATAAYDELEANLAGGAGPVVAAMVKGWYNLDVNGNLPPAGSRAPRTGSSDPYAAVNLGQLKTVAAPFYDRLMAYTNTNMLGYPWQFTGYEADDHAAANLGFAKNLFRFEVNAPVDQYNLPDWYVAIFDSPEALEMARGINPGGPRDPRDSDGDGILDIVEIQNGTDPLQSELLDSDGDGVPDYRDAWPEEALLQGRRQPDPRYAVIEVYQLGANDVVHKLLLGEGGHVAWEMSRGDRPLDPHTAHYWTGPGASPQTLFDPDLPATGVFRGIASLTEGGTVFGFWSKTTDDGIDGCTAGPVNQKVYPSARCAPGWMSYSPPITLLFPPFPFYDGLPHTRFASTPPLCFLADRYDNSWSIRTYVGEMMRNDFDHVLYCLDNPELTYFGTKLLASASLPVIVRDGEDVNLTGFGSLGVPYSLEAAFAPPAFIPNLNPIQPATLYGGDSLTFLTANDIGTFVSTAPRDASNFAEKRLFLSDSPVQGTRNLVEITSAFTAPPSSIVALSNDGIILTRDALYAVQPAGVYKRILPSESGPFFWLDFNSSHTAVGVNTDTGRPVILNNDTVLDLASRCGLDPGVQFNFVGGASVPQIVNDRGMIVAVTNSSPNGSIVLLVPVEMEWEALPNAKNVEYNTKVVAVENDEPSALAEMPGKGSRIFPDQKSPTDKTPFRNRCTLKIKSTPNTTVYLKTFDVDDATPEGFDNDPANKIDNNGRAGDDNLDTIWAKTGKFVATGSSTASVMLNSSGEAKVVFETTKQPGDNFRVALAFKQEYIATAQVHAPTASGFVDGDSEQQPFGFFGVVSPMLTVWRRLWCEFDSMGPPPPPGNPGDVDLSSETNVEVGFVHNVFTDGKTLAIYPLKDEANRFESGRIYIAGVGDYKVVSNTDRDVSDDVVVDGPVPQAAAGKQYWLFDDDYFPENEFARPSLPYRLSGGSLIFTAFAESFIEPIRVPKRFIQNDIAFNRNVEMISSYLTEWKPTVTQRRNIEGTEDLWSVYLLCAWQGRSSKDRDPETEESLLGETDPGFLGPLTPSRGNFGAIYIETIRESEHAPFSPRNTEHHTVVHEIGHEGGGEHDDGGIMADGAPVNKNHFAPKTIKRFRTNR